MNRTHLLVVGRSGRVDDIGVGVSGCVRDGLVGLCVHIHVGDFAVGHAHIAVRSHTTSGTNSSAVNWQNDIC